MTVSEKRERLFVFGWKYLDRRREHIGKSFRVARAIEQIAKREPGIEFRALGELQRELVVFLGAK